MDKPKVAKTFLRFCVAESRVESAIFACEILLCRIVDGGFCGFAESRELVESAGWILGIRACEILRFVESSADFASLWILRICILRVRFCNFAESVPRFHKNHRFCGF